MFKAYYIDFGIVVDVYAVESRNYRDLSSIMFLIYHPNPNIRSDERWMWVSANAFLPMSETEMINETDMKPKMNPPQLEWEYNRYF